MSRLHIADTGLFVAMGQPSNSRYQAVQRFARRNDIAFVLPERVYKELTVDDPDVEAPPVDAVIDESWAMVAPPLEFSDPIVSRTMDSVQRYIGNVDGRPAGEVERPAPAFAALAAQHHLPERVGEAKGQDHPAEQSTDTERHQSQKEAC